jgi:hypothetical protein
MDLFVPMPPSPYVRMHIWRQILVLRSRKFRQLRHQLSLTQHLPKFHPDRRLRPSSPPSHRPQQPLPAAYQKRQASSRPSAARRVPAEIKTVVYLAQPARRQYRSCPSRLQFRLLFHEQPRQLRRIKDHRLLPPPLRYLVAPGLLHTACSARKPLCFHRAQRTILRHHRLEVIGLPDEVQQFCGGPPSLDPRPLRLRLARNGCLTLIWLNRLISSRIFYLMRIAMYSLGTCVARAPILLPLDSILRTRRTEPFVGTDMMYHLSCFALSVCDTNIRSFTCITSRDLPCTSTIHTYDLRCKRILTFTVVVLLV